MDQPSSAPTQVKLPFPWKTVLVCLAILGVLIYLAVNSFMTQRTEPKEALNRTQLATSACSNRAPVTNAAAFDQATKPRGYAIFQKEGINNTYEAPQAVEILQIKDQPDMVKALNDSKAVKQISVVGCIEHHDEEKLAKTCPFQGVTASVYKAKHTLKIYKAKSGELLKEVEVPNDDSDECPIMTVYKKREGAKIYQSADIRAVLKEMQPFVQ